MNTDDRIRSQPFLKWYAATVITPKSRSKMRGSPGTINDPHRQKLAKCYLIQHGFITFKPTGEGSL